jgi:replication factor A1
LKAKVVGLEAPRDTQTKFGPGQVAEATLKDESGEIKTTLWNENITKVHIGDIVSIENAYVDSYKGDIQLNIGRYGKISKVEQ